MSENNSVKNFILQILSALVVNAFFLLVLFLWVLAIFWSSLTHLRTQRDIMCISVQLHT